MSSNRWTGLATLLFLGCGGSAPPIEIPGAAREAEPALVAAAATPHHAPVAPVPLEEYFKIRRIGSRGGVLLSFSHDDQLVAYLNDDAGRADIWVQPIAGGLATQITHTDGFVHSFAFSPTADVLVYEADIGGDELPHLFATDSRGTAPRDLTADLLPGRRTTFVDWARDGKTFLYASSKR